jgi:tetratricopeptide (TPR) repeat protein
MRRLLNTTIAILFFIPAVLAYQGADLERGIDLYNARKYAEAEQLLAQVVQQNGENARAHEYLGLARLSSGKLDEAYAELSRAEELAPASDSVKVGLARVLIEKKEFDRAEEALKKAREINGDNVDVPLYSGSVKLAKRNYQDAIKDLNDAIARKPDNAYAHYYAGLAYNGLKRPDKMVDSFQTFLKLAPDAPEAEKVRSLLRSVR